ncbi:MAG: hypothetical protein V3573_05850 [Desulfovibrionaceae bacterium]
MTGHKQSFLKTYARLFCLALLICVVAGCGGLKRPAVEKRHYDIRPERERQERVLQGVDLKVRRLQISPLYAGREMVFRNADLSYASDYYNTWFVPPVDMLSQGLRVWLDRSGLFAHVLEPSSVVGASLILEGVVNSLYGDFSGEQPVAVAEMQFLLIDESTPHNDIVMTGDYGVRIPLASTGPGDLALGLRQAVQEIFTQLEKELARVLAAY